MNTPICDFVKSYSLSGTLRFHMPGHKGTNFLGCEHLDITEIEGADVLYSPNGIIEESENNASSLFGSYHSFYSTEGSTLAIKTMLFTAINGCKSENPVILAARNVHKSFVYACALLDIDVKWLMPKERRHLCSCEISADLVEQTICRLAATPCAVYLTSPDYLGNILDIESISKVCHKYNVPLLVDNAHGAYLAFTTPNIHPLSLGADMCCDSAHKTLPVLTGGAYLHISKNAPEHFKDMHLIRNNFSLFASTSPSYLMLQSLDLCNKYLSNHYSERLSEHIAFLSNLKKKLSERGYTVCPSEPLKIVISCNEYGYQGYDLANILRTKNIEPEFADTTHLVLMFTPENHIGNIEKLFNELLSIPQRNAIVCKKTEALSLSPTTATSIRAAIFGSKRFIDVDHSEGKICASPTVSCPPAVPIVISGELICREHIELFKAYGIEKIEICSP